MEFAAAEKINRKYCADYTVAELDGLHYTFLQAPHCDGVAKASGGHQMTEFSAIVITLF